MENAAQFELDLTSVEGVKSFMSQAVSEQDWNDRCDRVKAANGDCPDFWFGAIVLSGIAQTTMAKMRGD